MIAEETLRMRSLSRALACVAALSAWVPLVVALEDHDHDQRGHGAHVHGLGKLDVAQQGTGLYLRLETPAASIVGFEHQPAHELERAALEAALSVLRDGATLFRLTETARCSLREVGIESTLLGAEGRPKGQGQGHEEDQAGAAEGHADFTAEYQFRCERPAELREIRVTLFEHFPGLERLHAQVASDRGQAGGVLTPTSPLLKL